MTLAWVAEVAALTEIFLSDDASLPRLDPQLRGKLARDELYKLGLPGKLILNMRKGLGEVLFS